MRNYIQPGLVIDHAPAAAVASGDAVAIGNRVGVANAALAANDTGSFSVAGVFELAKASGALTQGNTCYLNASGAITSTASGNTRAGYVWAAAADGDAVVQVKLDG